LSTIGSTLTWAPLAIIAVGLVGYVLLHLRKRRRERDEAAAYAAADASTES
jgi:membrane-associated protein